MSLQCSQKPGAESRPEAVESNPQPDTRLPETVFRIVFPSICSSFSQVMSCLQCFYKRQNGNDT
jgi:hypothetical protein